MKLKGNLMSNRVAVYVAGTDAKRVIKLLGCPETPFGTGEAESGVVKEVMMKWNIRHQVVNLVFDTTASNSSGEVGACTYLEMWVGSPILWTACRHHIYELHVNRMVEAVTGKTKDPGVGLFRRLKSEWHSLFIDYNDLVLFNYNSVPDWMEEEARAVLQWGEAELEKGTWPRDDYKEFLELVVVSLGGHVKNFKFRLPGADHHARWMSKGIYYMKTWLLSHVFILTEEEKDQVSRIFNFTVVIYAKAWFRSPLSVSAARNDLEFHYNVLRFREVEPTAAFLIMKSIRRHQWYTTGNMVTLALVDAGLDDCEREELAKVIHATAKQEIKTGRPAFPELDWRGEQLERPRLATLVTNDSWLVFQLLGLQSSQDWLLTPCSI